MKVVLPEPVGPTMLTTWPIVISMRPKDSGRPLRPCPLRTGNLLNHGKHTHALVVVHATTFWGASKKRGDHAFSCRGGKNGVSRPKSGFSATYGSRRQVSAVKYAGRAVISTSLSMTEDGLQSRPSKCVCADNAAQLIFWRLSSHAAIDHDDSREKLGRSIDRAIDGHAFSSVAFVNRPE